MIIIRVDDEEEAVVTYIGGAQGSCRSYTEFVTWIGQNIQVDDKHFGILVWWRDRQREYPILSIIARDILVVQASSVASECAFSLSGRVLTKLRSRLISESLSALVCLEDWLVAEKRDTDIRRSEFDDPHSDDEVEIADTISLTPEQDIT